jgi:hypothetical protein
MEIVFTAGNKICEPYRNVNVVDICVFTEDHKEKCKAIPVTGHGGL